MSWAQCATCEVVFASDTDFDRHLIRTSQLGEEYDNRCATLDEMVAQGWRQNGRGWCTRSPAMTSDEIARRRGVPAVGIEPESIEEAV